MRDQTYAFRIVLAVAAMALLPCAGVAGEKVKVSRGDRVVVSIDDAAVVDKANNVIARVARGQVLTVSHDNEHDWIPVEVTVAGKMEYGFISTNHARLMTVTDGLMSLLLVVLIHSLVVASIVLMLIFLAKIIFTGRDVLECLLRSASFAAGLLAYLAARVYGLSMPDLVFASLSLASPIALGVWGIIVPASVGVVVAWFCISMMKKDEDVGQRVMVLFSAFVFTMFSDVYAMTAGEIGLSQAKFGLPNATFVLGVVLYTIFTYRRVPKPVEWEKSKSKPHY